MNLIRWLTVTVRFLGAYAVLIAILIAVAGVLWGIYSTFGPDRAPSPAILPALLAHLPMAGLGVALMAFSGRLASWRANRGIDASGTASEWPVTMQEVGLTIVGFLLVFRGLTDLTRVATNLLVLSGELGRIVKHDALGSLVMGGLRIAAGAYLFAGAPGVRKWLARGARDAREGPQEATS